MQRVGARDRQTEEREAHKHSQRQGVKERVGQRKRGGGDAEGEDQSIPEKKQESNQERREQRKEHTKKV